MSGSRRHKPWTGLETERILKLARGGECTLEEAAKRNGRSLSAITNRLQKMGISPMTLKPIPRSKRQRKTVPSTRQPIGIDRLVGYELEVGARYKITVGDGRQNSDGDIDGICVKNYDNFIRFKQDNGLSVCYLKADLMNNPSRVKEL